MKDLMYMSIPKNIATSFFLALFIMCSFNTMAQIDKDYKNSIYFSAGSVIFDNQISLSYERTLINKDKFQTRLKAQASRLYQHSDFDENVRVDEKYVGIGLVQLIGLFEVGAGVAYTRYYITPLFGDFENGIITTREYATGPRLFGNVGLRYSKKGFLIKAGLGNLEFLYLGLGFNF